ncbi:MAG: hypothetical protein NTX57_23370 [Armatimonadetes bacterium]|nr:hypothetical protein [Armatimonadota bacterium]
MTKRDAIQVNRDEVKQPVIVSIPAPTSDAPYLLAEHRERPSAKKPSGPKR